MSASTILRPSASKSTAKSTSSSSKSTSRTRPYYFWRPNSPGGFLSQWYDSPFTDASGSVYATAEMYMMVRKARLFNDEGTAQKMLKTTNPKTHRALGRTVENFDEKQWDENKLQIVTEGSYLKFTTGDLAEVLRRELMETGERELVEASPYDRIWGIGFTEGEAEKNRQWWGENLLGKALVAVRERLRAEEKEEGGKK
ncbi:hypothetical protein DE146DRAFT_474993 [Phaeosphaeria sp. MPI-PUGE-AT-0046c]|nr:hypothetical protein DE146DRAFT_474993 [Phaeosphaeria sp. MPI-PUGE-AT-0046c]